MWSCRLQRRVAVVPFVMSIHPSVPARSVKDSIALARAKPGALGAWPKGSTTQELAAHIQAERSKWAPVIKAANIPLQSKRGLHAGDRGRRNVVRKAVCQPFPDAQRVTPAFRTSALQISQHASQGAVAGSQ
jgi:hypothetical protein